MIQSILAVVMAASGVTVVGDPGKADLARLCRSGVVYKEIAVEFCEFQISCNKLAPPRATECEGRPGKWVCDCVALSSEYSGPIETINQRRLERESGKKPGGGKGAKKPAPAGQSR